MPPKRKAPAHMPGMTLEKRVEWAAKKASMGSEEFERWSIEQARVQAAAIEELNAMREEGLRRVALNAAKYVPASIGHPQAGQPPPRSKFVLDASMAEPGASKSTPAASTHRPPMMLEQLRSLSREDLEAYCLQLQQQISALSSSSIASTGTTTLGTEELAKRVSTLRSIIATQLEKSFKWTVSCKRDAAIFNQSFAVPDPQLFLALTEQPKMLKSKKYSAEDFQEHVVRRELRGEIRYRTLFMTGNVMVKYDENEGILKITGRYGIRLSE